MGCCWPCTALWYLEEYPDGDGEIAHRVREALGPDFPIVITHDHHANVSEQVVRAATALVIYKTNPHLDQRERGLQAADILARTARGEVTPALRAAINDPLVGAARGYEIVMVGVLAWLMIAQPF